MKDDAILRRFLSKVDIRGKDECWNWTACTDKYGYGLFRLNNVNPTVAAHQVAYFVKHGELPKFNETGAPLLVCHTCDNSLCCNPEHLYLGTYSDNINDAYARGKRAHIDRNPRKTACKRSSFNAKGILAVRAMKGKGKSRDAVAAIFGVSGTTITRIWNSKEYPCTDGYYI